MTENDRNPRIERLLARLQDGREIFFENEVLGEGSEGFVYFEEGHNYVLKFYKDIMAGEDPDFFDRLNNIVYSYNPLLDQDSRDFWKEYFCWPEAIVVKPRNGVRVPAYSRSYYTREGTEKRMGFFVSKRGRALIPVDERGDWRGVMKMALAMARAVRRLHSAGLAHSDLSYNNFLGDPVAGKAVMIDLDGLVVPGIHPPKVLGTGGLIAPELLMYRARPSIQTDLHALAVLIYQVLLLRHPLRGPKRHRTETDDPKEHDWIVNGPGALFIEHPTDRSNRPERLVPEYQATGRYLASLIETSMIQGLYKPDLRPTAADWERALVHTLDMLVPCSNMGCDQGWFVLESENSVCPWCEQKIGLSTLPVLEFYKGQRGQKGVFKPEGTYLVAWDGQDLFEWHVFDNVWAGERASQKIKATISCQDGEYYLNSVDIHARVLTNGKVSRLSPGQRLRLEEGQQIKLDEQEYGRLATVRMLHL